MAGASVLEPRTLEVLQLLYLIGDNVTDKNVQDRITDLLANIATVDTVVDAIKVKTDNLPANTVTELDAIDSAISALQTVVNETNGYLEAGGDIYDNIDAILTDTGTTIPTLIGSPVDFGDGASIAGMLETMSGAGFSSTDSLKDIKAAVLSIQNNTLFTAAVIPVLEIPESGSADYAMKVNSYDSEGNMEDPDLSKIFVTVSNEAGTLRNSNLFEAANQTIDATKVAIYTITAPTNAPSAGNTYEDGNNTILTVLGMIGATKIVFSWTGVTEPISGTLTRTSGAGDSTLSSSAVNNDYVAMRRISEGRFDLFYNVPSTHTKENLTTTFMYWEGAKQKFVDRSQATQDYETIATTASQVWEELTTNHTTSSSMGRFVQTLGSKSGVSGYNQSTDSLEAIRDFLDLMDLDVSAILEDTADIQPKLGTISTLGSGATIGDNLGDIAGATFSTSTDSLEAIRNRIDTLVGTPVVSISSDIASLQSDITFIKTTLDVGGTVYTKINNLETRLGTPSDLGGGSTIAQNLVDIAGSGFNSATDSNEAISNKLDNLTANATSTEASATSALIAGGANLTVELGNAQNWFAIRAKLQNFVVSVASGACTKFDVSIYQKTGNQNRLVYITKISGTDGLNTNLNGLHFANKDTTPIEKLYVRVDNTNDSGSSTFSIFVAGEKLNDVIAS